MRTFFAYLLFFTTALVHLEVIGQARDLGSISGSIFSTSKSYDHKAEAGAEIKLYKVGVKYVSNGTLTNEDSIIVCKADIDGKFSLADLSPGKYFVVINGNILITDPYYVYNSIKFKSKYLEALTGYNFVEVNRSSITEIDTLFEKQYQLSSTHNTKKMDKAQKEMEAKLDILFKSLPQDIKYILHLYGSYTTSKYYDIVDVLPGKQKNLTIEFK